MLNCKFDLESVKDSFSGVFIIENAVSFDVSISPSGTPYEVKTSFCQDLSLNQQWFWLPIII